MMWKKYILMILMFSTLTISGIGLFNFIVDPFSIFRTIGDYSKDQIASHLRLFKAIAIRHQSADILLFGDSQIERGINPKTLSLITNETVFNSSMSSMTIYEIRKYLELSLKYSKPKLVVMGIQMYGFTSQKVADDYDEDYMGLNYHPEKLLLSVDTLKCSVTTFKQNLHNQQPKSSQEGLWFDASEEKIHDRFLTNEKHYIFDNAPKLNNFQYKDGKSTFDEYAKIIKICQDNNILLKIFISPSHSRQYEATAIGNGWETFEYWKKQLVSINEKIAQDRKKRPFEIWDFSGYHSLNSEPLPLNSYKSTKMIYFYESSHFTPMLGNIVLDRIFDSNISGGQNYPDFGVKLTNQNIEAHLEKIRLDRQRWNKTHPKDITEIHKLKSK